MQAWQMSAIKEHEEKSNNHFSREIYVMLTFFMGLVTQVMLLLNKDLLQIYVSPEYQSAWCYSGPLMVAFFVDSLSTFWGSFYIAQKKMKKYMLSAVVGAVANLVLNLCLIPWVGVIGAAVATLVSYVFVLLVRAIGIEKDATVAFVNKPLLSAFACSIVGMLAIYLIDPWSVILGVVTIVIYIVINRDHMLSFVHRSRIILHTLKKN